jgi:hypothetical protein
LEAARAPSDAPPDRICLRSPCRCHPPPDSPSSPTCVPPPSAPRPSSSARRGVLRLNEVGTRIWSLLADHLGTVARRSPRSPRSPRPRRAPTSNPGRATVAAARVCADEHPDTPGRFRPCPLANGDFPVLAAVAALPPAALSCRSPTAASPPPSVGATSCAARRLTDPARVAFVAAVAARPPTPSCLHRSLATARVAARRLTVHAGAGPVAPGSAVLDARVIEVTAPPSSPPAGARGPRCCAGPSCSRP